MTEKFEVLINSQPIHLLFFVSSLKYEANSKWLICIVSWEEKLIFFKVL